MLAGDVKVGGMIPVEVDGMRTYGIRVTHAHASAVIRKRIPTNIVPVEIHHPRNLNHAIVAINNKTEFEFDANDINPFRQRN